MDVQEYVKHTVTLEEAMREPCFKTVQDIVMPHINECQRGVEGNRHHEPISATGIRKLCHKWRQNPEAFFEPWSLPIDVNGGENFQNDQHDSLDIDHHVVFGHRKAARSSADAIRLIFHTVFFHDIVLAQAPRRRINAKLPRGGALPKMVIRAWKELTGKELSEVVANKLVDYVKVGGMCASIGKSMGEISWLLCPLFVLERKRFPKHKLLDSLKEKIRQLNLSNDIAHRIREVHQDLLLPSGSKRKRKIDVDEPLKRLKQKHHYKAKVLRPILSSATFSTNSSNTPLSMECHDELQRPCLEPLPDGIWGDVFYTPPLSTHWHSSPTLLSLEPVPSGVWDIVFDDPSTRTQCTNGALQVIPHETWDSILYAPPM